MTEMCDSCPMRRECRGEVDVSEEYQITLTETRSNAFRTRVVGDEVVDRIHVMVDDEGNSSDPFRIPPTRNVEQMEELVDDCWNPTTETKGVFRKREVVTGCAALGKFALGGELKASINSQLP